MGEWMRNLYRHLWATLRLDLGLVCELSRDMGRADYHDYDDSTLEEPIHFHVHRCARCGKTFVI